MAALTGSDLLRQLSALSPEALEAPIRLYVMVSDGDWTDEETHDMDGIHVVQPQDSREPTGEIFLEHTIIR